MYPSALRPSSRLALRCRTRVPEFTTSGGLPLATFRLRAGPPLELVTASMEPLAEPRRLLLALTVLVRPRLNTAPTPVPASALVAVKQAIAVIAPTAVPLTNVSFIAAPSHASD